MGNNGKNIIEKDNEKADLVAAGFRKLDSKLIGLRPPIINWGIIYKGMPDDKKISYLEKLASSMNHAASLVQGERDELNRLCVLKEEQIQKLNTAMRQNSDMLQSEITKINLERQEFNKEAVRLNRIIKELKGI